jgi:hypothetical protein
VLLVLDDGQIAVRGAREEPIGLGGVYARLHQQFVRRLGSEQQAAQYFPRKSVPEAPLAPRGEIVQVWLQMSTVKEIENAIAKLPLEEMEAVRDWLDDLIEDQLEVSEEFKAKIQRAKQEIGAGVYSRVRQPKRDK